MTLSRIFMLVAAFSIAAAAVPALAQGRGASQRPPKVTTAQGPKARTTGKPATKTPNANKPATKTPNANKPATKTPNANKPADPGGANRADRGRSEDARGTTGADRADRTIAERIAANPQQKARLEAMLPSGMTLEQASTGFRNQGQFIAALEASKNQSISFTELKTEMTGPNELSLGQAVQKLKPATTTTAP
jgi:hypothetical protein